jgi:O-antigen/teichoic acid export membrane protein
MTDSNANKRIAKNTLFLYLRMGLVLIVSLFTTRIVLQSLGVEDYGINNVVSGFVTMFAFLNTSMSNGVQRFYNYSLGRKNEYSIQDVYNTALQIQGLLAIVLLIILESVGLWYIYNQMVLPAERFNAALWVFQFSVISLLLLCLQIPYSAAIMAYERMDYYAYLSIFEVFAKLGVAFAIKNAQVDKLILYGFLNMIISLICFFLYFGYAKHHFKSLKAKFFVRRQLFRTMLSFSGWNVFGSFAYMIKGQGLNMLLNVFFGPVVNAARGVSGMIMNAIQGFKSNVVIAFRPQLVQSYASGDMPRVLKLFYSLSKVSFILLATLSIPIILEIHYILFLWLGDTVPDYSVPFTILVLINMTISSLNTPVSQVVHATGKMRNYQIGTSIVICATLPVSWLFLSFGYNPIVVYWISLIITILNQIVCNLLLKKVFYYSLKDYFTKVIIPCIVYSFLVPILPYIITIIFPQSFWRLLFTSVLSVLMSVVVSYFMMLDKSEKNMVRELIKRKI